MLVLGIESATAVASVALVDENGLAGEISLNRGLTHSQQLLPMVDALLAQGGCSAGQVEGLAVSAGPGSFTGLRIGMSLAKGLAQGWGVPIAGVSALEALAWQSSERDGLISPLIDAFRGEVYAALYRKDRRTVTLVREPQSVLPETWRQILRSFNEPVVLAGNGAKRYASVWESPDETSSENAGVLPETALHPLCDIRASMVAWLGRQKLVQGIGDDLYQLKPQYIRTAEIGKPERK
jgi:tRNA threonylcarbamoyladenosine biosynthesis protein TsaB